MAGTTITIADEDVLEKPGGKSSGLDVGGVYHSRSPRSHFLPAAQGRSRSRSLSRVSSAARTGDLEDGEDWRRDDSKKKQVFKGTTLLW